MRLAGEVVLDAVAENRLSAFTHAEYGDVIDLRHRRLSAALPGAAQRDEEEGISLFAADFLHAAANRFQIQERSP